MFGEGMEYTQETRNKSNWIDRLQTLEVTSPPGTLIGTIEQEWSILSPSFSVKDASGNTILKIEGPFCTFSMCGDVEFAVSSSLSLTPFVWKPVTFFFLYFLSIFYLLTYSTGEISYYWPESWQNLQAVVRFVERSLHRHGQLWSFVPHGPWRSHEGRYAWGRFSDRESLVHPYSATLTIWPLDRSILLIIDYRCNDEEKTLELRPHFGIIA